MKGVAERVHATELEIAQSRVPYDPDEDSWDGAFASVWHATFSASVVAAFVGLGWKLPEDLEEKIAWYARGHWPMYYASTNDFADEEEDDDEDEDEDDERPELAALVVY